MDSKVSKHGLDRTAASPIRAWNISTFVTGLTLAIKLLVPSVQFSVTKLISDLLLLMKSAKATDLFLMDLMLIRLPVKRLVLLGPGLILTSLERINRRDNHRLTCLYECVTLRMCPSIARKA